MSGPKPKDRVGESNVMKNGMSAKIIRYKSSAEIDIQFEDGIIVTNKTYASFQQGKIGHPNTLHKSKLKNRTSAENVMANGMKATIINYVSSTNIDIRFEDGAIRTGCTYKEFSSGQIAHPNHTSASMAKSRLGEKRMMNCGLSATITKYNKYHNIEITFEDGEVVSSVDYEQFKKGTIAHPKYDGTVSLQEAAIMFYFKEIGFVKMARGYLKDCALGNMELDLYNQKIGIAIEVDGRFHKSENAVNRDKNKNQKCCDANIKLYRIRDKDLPALDDNLSINYTLNGEKLYNGLVDCEEILNEIIRTNNIITPSKDFIDFKRDLHDILVYHFNTSLNYQSKNIVGEAVFHLATNQYMTILEYKDYQHVTVQFDDGATVYNKNYGAFKRGEIKHPNDTAVSKKQARLGESKVMNCGSEATIIAYRNSEDMDIEFQNGEIRRGVTYFNFSRGTIKNKI